MKKRYPVKQDLNLAQRDEAHRRKVRNTAIIALVVVVAIAAFCKFAVQDRLAALNDAKGAATAAEQNLAQAQKATANYDELTAEYQLIMLIHETVGYEIDPLDSLVLPETHLITRADVSALFVSEEIISVQFSGLTLEEISGIYSKLMEHELVDNVQVFTASTNGESASSQTGDQVTASMTIHLTTGKEDGKK